ncbi:MAG: succinyldiaminopimelate transaminase [Gammaproteobacteria bacterium]|nr:succinyldiaminopimelate transaminase [Gammaproteobacteria bacterium]
MNPNLDKLHRYPFERIAAMKHGVVGNPLFEHVSLSIGEPKHPPPAFIVEMLSEPAQLAADLAIYPATRGDIGLREAIARWIAGRFEVAVDPETQVLPVAGTREALFSFGQAALSGKPDAIAILPNPFYQIYEGAALLGNATPYYVNCERDNQYQPDYERIPESIWKRCEILYLCSPGNPTGRTLSAQTIAWLLAQAERFDFLLAADECYSEIYPNDGDPPIGLLQAAGRIGRTNFQRCVVFHSLSKRSNLPGLRSGFVAGDAAVLGEYFKYRTYQGCALPAHTQRASTAAWLDEDHVVANRVAYQKKFDAVTPILNTQFEFEAPDGGFYHWLYVGADDQAFARSLYADCNITVLPGSFLGRSVGTVNPGQNHIRVAWVASEQDCIAAAQRMVAWAGSR